LRGAKWNPAKKSAPNQLSSISTPAGGVSFDVYVNGGALMSLEDLFCNVAALVPRRRKNEHLVALCYHRLSDRVDGSPLDRFTVSQQTFVHHISTILESGLEIIGPDRLFEAHNPAVMLTFDDNLPSHVQDALPVLEEFGVPGTFFLNPGELGQPEQLSHREVDALLEAGMWVGAHSNQRIPACLYDTSQEFEEEVTSSREYLESLGMPLIWAYPGGFIGSYEKMHDDILRRQGFDLRFSTVEGPCDPRDSGRVQGRYVIRRNCNDRYFRSAIEGGLQVLSLYKTIRAKIWPASKSRADLADYPRL
jgi:peptidoglycan/xylan/chitin deacetylase (PgdA/CDA1 family)